MVIYEILDEIIKINTAYPAIYDMFCVSIMFFIACGYNVFKNRNLTFIGILLSTILTYSTLYLIIKMKLFGIVFDADMKLIISVLSGFLSIEFFEKFNPVTITDLLIRILTKQAMQRLGKDTAFLETTKEEGSDKSEKEGINNNKEIDNDTSEDTSVSGKYKSKDSFRETK